MTGLFRRERGANLPPYGGADPRTFQTKCPSCGLLNDGSARFCRNCGLPLGWPQDPVRGTTTRRAELPSERGSGLASIVGLVAALALLAGAAFLVSRLGGSSGTTLLPVPSASTAASASSALSSPTDTFGSIQLPTSAADTIEPSALPSSEATSQPTAPAGGFSPTTGFTCDLATLSDPTGGRWRIIGTNALRNGNADEMTVRMSRAGDVKTGPALTIESMSPSDVTARYGIAAPSGADRAIVVSFEGRVTISVPQAIPATGLPSIVSTDVETDSTGTVRAVLGVVGTGCHQLSVPPWASDRGATTIDVLIDVKRR
jgi:hypothetical protein